MKNSQKGRKHRSDFDLKNFTGNDDVSILANDSLLGHKTNKRTNNNIIIKACKEKKNYRKPGHGATRQKVTLRCIPFFSTHGLKYAMMNRENALKQTTLFINAILYILKK